MVTYGSEAWTITEEIQNKINAFEFWIYCRVLKLSWRDMVGKKEVLQRMVINMHLLNSVIKGKLQFLDIFVEAQVGMI